MKVFCIPGLGLSRSFFRHLDIRNGDVDYLDWIEPNTWESLQAYANRISQPLENVDGDIILIGHSFGGVIAQEIARIHSVKAIVLISSIVHPEETPGRLKLLSQLGLHRFITKGLILSSFPLWAPTHSYRTRELRQLFRQSVKSLSSHYFQWSLLRIATWPGAQDIKTPILRIHGTKDVTFLYKKTKHVDHVISGGDHNMIYSKGDDLSEIIQSDIQNLA